MGDAVCSRTDGNYLNGLSLCVYGRVVTNTETVFFDLMKQAGTPLVLIGIKIDQLNKNLKWGRGRCILFQQEHTNSEDNSKSP